SPLSLASLYAPSYSTIAVLPSVGLKNRTQPALYHLSSHNIPNSINHQPYPIAPPPFDPRLVLDPADLRPSTHPSGHIPIPASLRKKLAAELDMTPRGVQVRPSPSRPLGVPSADQQIDVLHPPFFNATSESACHMPVDLTDDTLPACACRSMNGSTIEIALSSVRLSTVRDVSAGSAASSIGPSSGAGIPQAAQRLSVDLAHLIMNAQGRPLSILSSGSSLRPLSTLLGISVDSTGCSARSLSSSVVSHDREKECEEKEGKKASRESRRSSESHRRTPISEIFPETQVGAQRQSMGLPSPPPQPRSRTIRWCASRRRRRMGTLRPRTTRRSTPVQRARARPVSEQT
ncbi:hypothetical protein BD309DRAFT_1072008, partial [Dichomitus squalens]